MQALAGERVEEPGRIADEQPARSGATRDAVAERPGAGDARRSARRRASAAGSSSVGGMAATIASATARAPSRASAGRHDRPEHDPDVDPAAGHRRDPDIAVAQDAHPGVAAARPGRGRGGGRSARPADRAGPAGRRRPPRATTECGPSAPTTTARGSWSRRPVGLADASSAPVVEIDRRRRASRAGRRRRPAASSSSAGSSRDRSNPTAGSPPVSAP